LLDRLNVQCVLQVDMAEDSAPPGFRIAARGEGLRLLDLE
jgi:hypothetical protein